MKKVKILMTCLSFLLLANFATAQTELPPVPPIEEKNELSEPDIQTPPTQVTEVTEEVEPTFIQKAIDWFTKNWGYILGFLGIVEIIVRLTPSEKDNAYFAWFSNLLDSIIPNFKKGGGTHNRIASK